MRYSVVFRTAFWGTPLNNFNSCNDLIFQTCFICGNVYIKRSQPILGCWILAKMLYLMHPIFKYSWFFSGRFKGFSLLTLLIKCIVLCSKEVSYLRLSYRIGHLLIKAFIDKVLFIKVFKNYHQKLPFSKIHFKIFWIVWFETP